MLEFFERAYPMDSNKTPMQIGGFKEFNRASLLQILNGCRQIISNCQNYDVVLF
jgi:hypothetical protein